MKITTHNMKQSGATLFTALIFLLILTLIGVTALRESGISERMATNSQISKMAYNAAESAMDTYIAEYNYQVSTVATTETEVNTKTAYLAKYVPTQSVDGWIEFCVDSSTSVIEQITGTADGSGTATPEVAADCTSTTIDGTQSAVRSKNRVNYNGCPGTCPKYSLGLGKQKISCHILEMESEGQVENATVAIDQWVSLQGPC